MDPLSVTASIVAVLQTANAIISLCYDCKSVVKGTPWALTQTITELQDLRHVLETLDSLAEADEKPQSSIYKSRSLEILCDPQSGPLVTCRRELQHLSTLVGLDTNATSDSRRRAVLRAVQWQFREKDVKHCLERIERCKTTLGLAITADEVALLRRIQEMGFTAATDLYEIGSNLDTFVQTVQDRERRARRINIISWQSPVHPAESHETALTSHQLGTNDWFMESEEFKCWLESPSSSLWVSGLPGAGKTIMFANTVGYLRKYRLDWHLSYFYIDFRRNEAQEVVNIMGSLVAQICSQSNLFPDELEQAYDQSTSSPGQRLRPTLSLLSSVLMTVTVIHDVVLLVDALDECERPQDASAFLITLQHSCRNVRVLVTSRAHPEVQEGLQLYPGIRLEGHTKEVNRDIAFYINQRLENARQLQWLSESVKRDISSLLVEKSEGM